MRVKQYPIQIWILHEDPGESAKMLSDKYLKKTITGCIQALVTTYFYFFGIRSKKFYNFYFSKEKLTETLDRFFPLWPSSKKPSFQQYTSKTSKWCRSCFENFEFVKTYLEVLCLESEFRFGKPPFSKKILDWISLDAPKINLPKANLKRIVFDWKSLNPKYRKKDICLGYRLQYKAILQNDGIKITDFSKRDIPEFLIDKEAGIEQWMI